MPRCVNQNFVPSSPGDIAVLQAYMNPLADSTFADIRLNVVPLSALSDAELQQVCQDAGFQVNPN